MRILYVEDEKYLADAVIHLLKKANIEVDWADNGNDGLKLAEKPVYDCFVLDIMLPGISGLEILEAIRKKGINTPVIMLSALSQVEDKVKGLELGADDYLAKPFKTAELIARINAICRRPPVQDTSAMEFEDLHYDADNRAVNSVALTEKEAEILKMLIQNPAKVQAKDYILSHVWGSNAVSDDNYVEVYVSYLRKKLKKANSHVTIKTVRNLGYKLCSED